MKGHLLHGLAVVGEGRGGAVGGGGERGGGLRVGRVVAEEGGVAADGATDARGVEGGEVAGHLGSGGRPNVWNRHQEHVTAGAVTKEMERGGGVGERKRGERWGGGGERGIKRGERWGGGREER